MQGTRVLAGITLSFLLGLLLGPAAKAQQASLSVEDCGIKSCLVREHKWCLTKTTSTPTIKESGCAIWKVTATKDKDGSPCPTLVVNGWLKVTNDGSADAPIGNLVINLQQKADKNAQHTPWVSLAADMATSEQGCNATFANLLAKATQEDPDTNLAQGPGNYCVGGERGTFKTTAWSGKLECRDENGKDIFAPKCYYTLCPGQCVKLCYRATFCLPKCSSDQVRVEALVSFGNAGQRGKSGASAYGIDIYGNQNYCDWVRTVPCRTSCDLPKKIEDCNDCVIFTDPCPTVTGGARFSNFKVYDATGCDVTWEATTCGIKICDSTCYTVKADVWNCGSSGQVCNTAYLNSEDECGWFNGCKFVCCKGVHLCDKSCVDVCHTD
jgi:hypothetical protein